MVINGDLTVICSIYRVEDEQDWENIQFLSTATVLFLSLGLGLGLGFPYKLFSL